MDLAALPDLIPLLHFGPSSQHKKAKLKEQRLQDLQGLLGGALNKYYWPSPQYGKKLAKKPSSQALEAMMSNPKLQETNLAGAYLDLENLQNTGRFGVQANFQKGVCLGLLATPGSASWMSRAADPWPEDIFRGRWGLQTPNPAVVFQGMSPWAHSVGPKLLQMDLKYGPLFSSLGGL